MFEGGSTDSVLVKVLRPEGAPLARYTSTRALDPYVPFTMGPLLTLVLSFAFAWVWDWLVTDRVTRWLRSFWGR